MKEILVGLSGGVDSAVTVKLLQEQGFFVRGVFLKMLPENDLKRAEILAKQLGIELLVENLTNIFRKEVIEIFVKNYQKGLTPNPCVHCNPKIKFKHLLAVADKLNIDLVATGHYAKIKKVGNDFILEKGEDKIKDQSYFLSRLSQQQLARIKLPLGEFRKDEIKNIAKKDNLSIPKSESQDVCFLAGIKTIDFLKKYSLQQEFLGGDIINENGEVVGQHKGLLGYTIGQRKGLDLGGGPFYVIGKDREKNILLVSRDRNGLNNKEVVFGEVSWINEAPKEGKEYQAKIRSQMKEVAVTVDKLTESSWRIKSLKNDFWAVAPGQAVVVYDREKVVGGGVIASL